MSHWAPKMLFTTTTTIISSNLHKLRLFVGAPRGAFRLAQEATRLGCPSLLPDAHWCPCASAAPKSPLALLRPMLLCRLPSPGTNGGSSNAPCGSVSHTHTHTLRSCLVSYSKVALGYMRNQIACYVALHVAHAAHALVRQVSSPTGRPKTFGPPQTNSPTHAAKHVHQMSHYMQILTLTSSHTIPSSRPARLGADSVGMYTFRGVAPAHCDKLTWPRLVP